MNISIPTSSITTNYRHKTVDMASYLRFIRENQPGRRKVNEIKGYGALYHRVEYFNSPLGLIVFAHHDTVDGQIDGLHPASLSEEILSPRNIVEPITGVLAAYTQYNSHWMGRKYQGKLLIRAFGKTIYGRDEEAPMIMADEAVRMEVFAAPFGPFVGVLEAGGEVVHMIAPTTLV